MEKRKIRTIFPFQFMLGQNAEKTAPNINDEHGTKINTERTIPSLFKEFRSVGESLENDERFCWNSDVENDLLRASVNAKQRTTFWKFGVELYAKLMTISSPLKETGKSNKPDKWVPHELCKNQNNRRFETFSALLLHNNRDPFLYRFVTCDEK